MSAPARAAGAIALALIATVPLVVWTGFPEQFEFPKLLLLTLAAAALVLVGALSRRVPLPSGPLDWVAVAALPIAALTTFTSSNWRDSLWGAHDSWAGFLTWLGLAAFYAAARTLRPESSGWARALLAGMAVVTAWAFAQALGWDPIPWARTATWCERLRPFGTVGHPNSLAGYLAIASPLITGWAFARRGRGAIVGGVIVIAAAVACALTLSRAGWLAFALGMATSGLLLSRLGLSARTRAVIVGGAALAAAALVASSPSLRTRLTTVFEAPARGYIYRGALAMFRERPLLGVGLDQFQVGFQRHREPRYWDHEWGRTPQRAHNELLQALATQGLVGGALLLAMMIAAVMAVRAAWSRSSDQGKAIVAGAAGALTAGVVHGAFGFHVIATWTPLLLAGALLGGATRSIVTPRLPRLVVGGVLALALLGFGVARPAVAYAMAREGDARRARADLLGALDSYRRALDWAPWSDWHAARLGTFAGELRAPEALPALTLAARHAPLNAYHHANLGRHFARYEVDAARSRALYDRALELDPANALLRQDAAESALALGERERARALVERVVSLYPGWGGGWSLLGEIAVAQQSPLEAQAFFAQAISGVWHGDERARTTALRRIEQWLRTTGHHAEADAARAALTRPSGDLAGACPAG